jgi:hypothetical protein
MKHYFVRYFIKNESDHEKSCIYRYYNNIIDDSDDFLIHIKEEILQNNGLNKNSHHLVDIISINLL